MIPTTLFNIYKYILQSTLEPTMMLHIGIGTHGLYQENLHHNQALFMDDPV